MPCFSRLAYAAALYTSIAVLGAAERPRLAVLTDIGADPDDQQSMIRLMVYANEFDLELLIATGAGTPGEMKEAITRPESSRTLTSPACVPAVAALGTLKMTTNELHSPARASRRPALPASGTWGGSGSA